MTRDELDACIDIGAHQRFIEARNRLIYHYEYNAVLAQRLFEDGELYEISEHHGAFIARLTYERALMLSQNADVAYIDSLG